MSDDLSLNAEPEMPAPPHRRAHWIFWGADGLRAGWSALLFVAILVGLSAALAAVSRIMSRNHPHAPHGMTSLRTSLIGEAVAMLLVLAVTWIMSRIEGRRLPVYGYAGRARLLRFFFGLVWGLVALAGLIAALWTTHHIVFDAGHLHAAAAWKYGLGWMAFFMMTAVFEESLLRGYLQYTLTRGIGFWWGALVMSLLFGLIHGQNAGESPVGLFSAGAVGLVFCISLWYTGSLWWAIGFHAAWDWAQTFLFGTADSGFAPPGHYLTSHPAGPLLLSGGPTGPEGSLYIAPLLLLMALCMWLWWRRKPVSGPYDTNA